VSIEEEKFYPQIQGVTYADTLVQVEEDALRDDIRNVAETSKKEK
jgi:hypothetical protein